MNLNKFGSPKDQGGLCKLGVVQKSFAGCFSQNYEKWLNSMQLLIIVYRKRETLLLRTEICVATLSPVN